MALFKIHFHGGAVASIEAATPQAARELAKARGSIARVKLDRSETVGRRLRRRELRSRTA